MKWKWKDSDWKQSLYDEDGRLVCLIRKMAGQDGWNMYAPAICDNYYSIQADTKEEAMWRATLIVGNECNRIANHYHKIRDHLPDIHELARVAGI